jgi:ATP-dependent RNA helicase DDX3X
MEANESTDTNEDADHVYIMTSATFPKGVRKMANEYLAQDFTRIRIGQTASAHKNIRQNIIWVDQDQKREAVYDLLFQMEPARTMIFCNTKGAVDNLDDYLYNRQLPTTSIHGDRNQREREDAMRAFRTGKAPILIATGVSARGWDVKDCKHVINYDLPSGMYGGVTEYIHRVGRTARIGNQGLATSFYNDRNDDIAQELVNVLVDCDCPVPEFLQQYVPEDGKVNFDDNSEDEEVEESAGDGGFGGGDEGASASAWGAAPTESGDGGFSAADGAAAADAGW